MPTHDDGETVYYWRPKEKTWSFWPSDKAMQADIDSLRAALDLESQPCENQPCDKCNRLPLL